MKLKVRSYFSPLADIDERDARDIAVALNHLGYYLPDPRTGIVPFDPDYKFFNAIKKFQNEHGLFPDGALRPGGETESAINEDLEKKEESEEFYVWRTMGDEKVRPSHADMNGQLFRWNESTGEGHPGDAYNCRCWAEQVYAGYKPPPLPQRKPEVVAGQPKDGINNFYGDIAAAIVATTAAAPAGRMLLAATGIYKNLEARRLEALEKLNRNTTWTFGKHKSAQKWENRMESRKWTEQQITDTIKNGKKYPAPNNVNKGNEAARYEYKGRYVVRDEVNKETLQISGKNFNPEPMPK